MELVVILQEILALGLDVAPWLLMGLVAAGLIKGFVPDVMLQRWIGGSGIGAIGRAAIIGAPLPLCSCGAIPTALTLYRNGAGRGPTTAFMVSTPGIGADSVAITYALLGPVMMLARVLGALVSAIATGLLVAAGQGKQPTAVAPPTCGAACCDDRPQIVRDTGVGARMKSGLFYAFNDILDEIGVWILAGLVLAGLITWAVPPQAFAAYATGIPAMLMMAVIGIPIYICATAATPIAAAMLLTGVSPGAVLVFLLAGPITSMATLVVLKRAMGTAALARYLVGVLATTVLFGLLFDQTIGWFGVDVVATMGTTRDLFPDWLAWISLMLLVLLGIRPVRQTLIRPA